AAVGIPEFDLPRLLRGGAPAGGSKPVPVRTEGHAVDSGGMPLQVQQLLAGADIPDFYLTGYFFSPREVRWPTARSQPLAVRAERHAPDRTGVPPQGQPLPARIAVPDSHGLIVAVRGQAASVGAPGHTSDALCASLQVQGVRAGSEVPELDGAVTAGGGEPPAIRAESHTAHVGRVALEGQQLLAGGGVPYLDRVVYAARGQI